MMPLSECAQVSVFFFQWHAHCVIYVLLSDRQPLLLGRSGRGAATSLFSPDLMMSGLSAPSLKLAARHPSCWSGSRRDPSEREPQLGLDRATVSAVSVCVRPEDDHSITYSPLFIVSMQLFRQYSSESTRVRTVVVSFCHVVLSCFTIVLFFVMLTWSHSKRSIPSHTHWGCFLPAQSIQHINSIPYLKLIFGSLCCCWEVCPEYCLFHHTKPFISLSQHVLGYWDFCHLCSDRFICVSLDGLLAKKKPYAGIKKCKTF